jgi:hypothetical protein
MMKLVGDDLYWRLVWNRWFSGCYNGELCLDPVVFKLQSVVELTHSPHGTLRPTYQRLYWPSISMVASVS